MKRSNSYDLQKILSTFFFFFIVLGQTAELFSYDECDGIRQVTCETHKIASTIDTKINILDIDIKEDFQETWTAIAALQSCCDNNIGSCECAPTPISNSDAIGNIITISSPGYYCITEEITNKIVISVDDVSINLKHRKVSLTDGNENIITINSNLENIEIFDGSICNEDSSAGTGCGILINSGTSKISLEKIQVCDCGIGIKLNGTYENKIIACQFVSCDFIANTVGLTLNYADKNLIKECYAADSTQKGFELSHSSFNSFVECHALGIVSETTAIAFKSDSGESNLFKECTVKGTKTSGDEFGYKSYGFLLTGTETKTKIIECIINETDVISTVSAIAYGIALEPVILESEDLLIEAATELSLSKSGYCVHWSPDSRHLVTGDSNDDLTLFRFDGSTLTQIDQLDVINGTYFTVDWSPNGRYIAAGNNTGKELYVFEFKNSSLTQVDYDTKPYQGVFSVKWSPDGRFIAVGDSDDDDDDDDNDGGGGSGQKAILVYVFDGNNLTKIIEDSTPVESVLTVDWSPNTKSIVRYIVSGESVNVSGKGVLRVFSFDGNNFAEVDNNDSTTGGIKSADWSPDGKHIAVAACNNPVQIFSFDGTNLQHVVSSTITDGHSKSVSWSPNGKYLSATYSSGKIRLFEFNGISLTEIAVTTVFNNEPLRSVSWSSGGKYIATVDTGKKVRIFSVMNAPMNCFVEENIICDTVAYCQFVGTGVLSGGSNFVIKNESCNNEVGYTYGVPNIFYDDHPYDAPAKPFDNISIPPIFS